MTASHHSAASPTRTASLQEMHTGFRNFVRLFIFVPMIILVEVLSLDSKGTHHPDSIHGIYVLKTLSQKLYSLMQIFYHEVYLIFPSDLLLQLY
jgi:hypothetical protein